MSYLYPYILLSLEKDIGVRDILSLLLYWMVYFWGKYPASTHRLGQIQQISCLICLPDKSGNFLAFRAETRKNTVKSEKTGFGMSIETVPGPVFYVFRAKIPCTFCFKFTEQSSRKKLAVGGFEPETWFDSDHLHQQKTTCFDMSFFQFASPCCK